MLFFACSSPPPSLPLGRPGSEGKEKDAPALVKKVTLMSSTCSLSSFPLPLFSPRLRAAASRALQVNLPDLKHTCLLRGRAAGENRNTRGGKETASSLRHSRQSSQTDRFSFTVQSPKPSPRLSHLSVGGVPSICR